MKILTLKLKNFRNYTTCKVDFASTITILIGDNGQGKTNLLESILYLSTTRSFRVDDDKLMIKKGEQFSSIEASIQVNTIKKLQVILHPEGKSLFAMGNKISRSSDFIGIVNAVLFAPSDIELFEDSPKVRRRLMDIEIGKINKHYMKALNNYTKLVKDRNQLLKNQVLDHTLFKSLEDLMIQQQGFIIKQRQVFIDKINETLTQYYQALSNSSHNIHIQYECCIQQQEDFEKEFAYKYQRLFDKDLALKMTTFGIHREDLTFYFDEFKVEDFTSQGQRRLIILAFKLALIEYIKEYSKELPILLLDDVLSELDEKRRRNLFKVLNKDIQTIITTTGIDDDLGISNYKVIKIVDKGVIYE